MLPGNNTVERAVRCQNKYQHFKGQSILLTACPLSVWRDRRVKHFVDSC